jgi:hypothetical protein
MKKADGRKIAPIDTEVAYRKSSQVAFEQLTMMQDNEAFMWQIAPCFVATAESIKTVKKLFETAVLVATDDSGASFARLVDSVHSDLPDDVQTPETKEKYPLQGCRSSLELVVSTFIRHLLDTLEEVEPDERFNRFAEEMGIKSRERAAAPKALARLATSGSLRSLGSTTRTLGNANEERFWNYSRVVIAYMKRVHQSPELAEIEPGDECEFIRQINIDSWEEMADTLLFLFMAGIKDDVEAGERADVSTSLLILSPVRSIS